MFTIATMTQECIAAFSDCLRQVTSVLLENQLARLHIWSNSMRVLELGRYSLGHRFRMATDVLDTCTSLLEVIPRRIRTCASQHNDIPPDFDDVFQKSIKGISEPITLLSRLSETIHGAIEYLYVTEAAHDEMYKICDDNGNDTESLFIFKFANFIRHLSPQASHAIQGRLVNSTIMRRKLIMYRRSQHGNTPIQVQHVPSQIQRPLHSPGPTAELQSPSESRVTGTSPTGGSDAAPHGINAQNETTPAYGKFTPPVVSENAVAEVMYPFCFYAIPASDAADQERWESHVMQDLDVYMCPLDDCESATKMYTLPEIAQQNYVTSSTGLPRTTTHPSKDMGPCSAPALSKSSLEHTCHYPGCESKPFKRRADLDQPIGYFCDYQTRSRHIESLHRVDHYRDHLREHHKEDLVRKNRRRLVIQSQCLD